MLAGVGPLEGGGVSAGPPVKDVILTFLVQREGRPARIREIRAAVEAVRGTPVPQSTVRSALQDDRVFLRIYAGLYRLQPGIEVEV